MTIRMGYWDCPACSHKRIEGPLPNCPACGKPRGAEVQFYTDDAAPVVEDPELIARARMGADWHCRYCGADNRAGMIDCQTCGAGPDGTKRRAERIIPNAQPPKPPSRVGLILAAMAVLAAVLFGGCWFLFMRTTALKVTVVEATWSKSIQIEELKAERKSDWKEDVPADAREISRTPKSKTTKVQEGTTKVKTGKKDLGNGMFEDIYKEEPKYVEKKVEGTWVTYEVDRWIAGQTLKKETTDESEPPDPAFTESKTQRIGKRTNELVLALSGGGKSYTYAIDLSKESSPKTKVSAFKKGQTFTAMVTTAGAVTELKP